MCIVLYGNYKWAFSVTYAQRLNENLRFLEQLQREACERRKEEREGLRERLSCSGRKCSGDRLGSLRARAAVWERESFFFCCLGLAWKRRKGNGLQVEGNKVK